MIANTSLSLLLVVALARADAAESIRTLSNEEAQSAIEQSWSSSTVEPVPLGKVAISHGLSNERNPSHRRYNQKDLRTFAAWARAGILKIEEQPDQKKKGPANDSGWNAFWNLTQEGVGSTLLISLTPRGRNLNVSKDPNFVVIPLGAFRIRKITSNEELTKDFDRYRLVHGLHDAELTPEFAQAVRFLGNPVDANRRKFRALFKLDKISGQWKLYSVDLADEDKDFPTNFVQKALDNPK